MNFSRYGHLVICTLFAVLMTACNKDKVPEETLWGIYQEPIEPKELPADSGAEELKILWDASIGGGANDGFAKLVPTIAGDSVYIANREGVVYRRNARTGDVIWKIETEQAVNAAIAVGEGIVVFSHDNGTVRALASENGNPLWETNIKRNVSAIPAIGKGRIVVRTSDGLVIGIDSKNGEIAWQVTKEIKGLTLHGDSKPVITGDAVLVGLSNGKLIANNVISGRDYWEAELSFVQGQNELERLNDSDSPPIVQGSLVYSSTYQGSIVAVQIQNASTVWRTDLSTRLAMASNKSSLIVIQELGEVVSLDIQTGEKEWSQDAFTGHGVSPPVFTNNRILIGDSKGNLHTLDPKSGALIETRKISKGAILGIVNSDNLVTAFTSEGDLVAVSL